MTRGYEQVHGLHEVDLIEALGKRPGLKILHLIGQTFLWSVKLVKATSTPAEYQNRFEHLKMFYSCSLLLYLGRLRMKRTAGRVSVWGGMRIVQRDCVMRWLSKERKLPGNED
jgi:hypothetical protein